MCARVIASSRDAPITSAVSTRIRIAVAAASPSRPSRIARSSAVSSTARHPRTSSAPGTLRRDDRPPRSPAAAGPSARGDGAAPRGAASGLAARDGPARWARSSLTRPRSSPGPSTSCCGAGWGRGSVSPSWSARSGRTASCSSTGSTSFRPRTSRCTGSRCGATSGERMRAVPTSGSGSTRTRGSGATSCASCVRAVRSARGIWRTAPSCRGGRAAGTTAADATRRCCWTSCGSAARS